MQSVPAARASNPDAALRERVAQFDELTPDDQNRLRELAADLASRGMQEPFIAAALRSTAEVLAELRADEERPETLLRREAVRRLMADHDGRPDPSRGGPPRRERRREERERLHQYLVGLVRQARQARGRHEVKKIRSLLLRVDQREVRRSLGLEGEELCRQMNTWLRSAAPMF